MKKIFTIISLILLLASCNKINTSEIQEGTNISVTSTLTSISSIVQYIGGEHVSVTSLVKPGFSPHTFDLKPSDIKSLESSDIIFSTGLEIDNFMIEKTSNKNIIFVKDGIQLLEGHEHNHDHEDHEEHEDHEDHEEHEDVFFDPHFWLSLENSKIIAKTIADELSIIDSENSEEYTQNYNNFVIEADLIKKEFLIEYSEKQQKDFIVFHEAYNYLFEELGISHDNMLVLEDTAGREPSVIEMKNNIDLINDRSINIIFKEPQFESKLISTLTQEYNLDVYILDPLGNSIEKNGYFENMKTNLNNLKNIYE